MGSGGTAVTRLLFALLVVASFPATGAGGYPFSSVSPFSDLAPMGMLTCSRIYLLQISCRRRTVVPQNFRFSSCRSWRFPPQGNLHNLSHREAIITAGFLVLQICVTTPLGTQTEDCPSHWLTKCPSDEYCHYPTEKFRYSFAAECARRLLSGQSHSRSNHQIPLSSFANYPIHDPRIHLSTTRLNLSATV